MKPAPIDYLLKPISRFIGNESTAGILLFASALIAIAWANSPWAHAYHELWEYKFSIGFSSYTISKDLHHWINDGLMALFFFVIGLELKREIMGGELSSIKKAILPLGAAAGGMIVPALLYVAFNPVLPAKAGWGIPMATDIAFALGVLALLGSRVPVSLKIFLTALAVADDLGAVLVIAFFYTSDISLINLGLGGLFLLVLVGANYAGVRNALFYGVVGICGVWLTFLLSGVHATIAGVLIAFTIPARTKINELGFTEKLNERVKEFCAIPPNDTSLLEPEQMHVIGKIRKLIGAVETPLQRLEHSLHGFVSFVIMPLFALANAGITFDSSTLSDLQPVTTGVAIGLFAGKFLGVLAACWLMIKFGWASLPLGVKWKHITGMAFLAGIGFTMSLFIATLAFDDVALINDAKIGIMGASFIAGITGYVILRTMKSETADL